MISAYNKGTTLACNGVQSLVEKEGIFQRHVQSRLAAPFTAVPLLCDAAVNLVASVDKAFRGLVTKIGELAMAFFGQDRDYGSFAGQAAHHLGKALLGIVAAPLTLAIGLVSPSTCVAACRALGLAATPVAADPVQPNYDLEAQLVTSASVHSHANSAGAIPAANPSTHESRVASVHCEQKQPSLTVDQQPKTSEEVTAASGGPVVLYQPPARADTDSKVKALSLFEKGKEYSSKLWNNESTPVRYGFRAGAVGVPAAAAVGSLAWSIWSYWPF